MSTLVPIDKNSIIRAAVRKYIVDKLRPVRISKGAKGPRDKDWQKRDWKPEDFTDEHNVGLQTGPCAAGNFIGIDGDCSEAIALMPHFLPDTGMKGGRPSRGRCHFYYLGDVALPYESFAFGHKGDRKVLIEFSSSEEEISPTTGEVRPASGHQMVAAPSVHPSGEQYELTEGAPASVSSSDLLKRVRVIAAGALICRHFPEKERHRLELALGGALLRGGWAIADAEHFVFHVFTVGGSEDPARARTSLADSEAKLAVGEKCTGIPTLIEILGKEVVDRVCEWLDLGPAKEEKVEALPYTDEELSAIAVEAGCTVAELKKRWILQTRMGGSYYLLSDRGYIGPIIQQSLSVNIKECLSRAPMKWVRIGAKGQPIKLSVAELVAENGSSIKDVYADMTLQRSRFEAVTATLFEATCPLRKLPPLDPGIDMERIQKWMLLLGGEKILDWATWVIDLSRQTSGLYLQGPKGAGKSMFAHGVARLWTPGSPTLLDDITGGFNSSLARCPLVFGDEEAKVPSSKVLRTFIGSDGLTLKRKFLPDASLRGCPRLVLAGNRDDLLHFDQEIFAQDDIAAVASRFLHLKSTEAAAEYLRSIGGRHGTDQWVNGDLIARFVVHLAMTRDVIPGDRFLVEGDAGDMAQKLATGGTVRGLIIEAVARALALSAAKPVERPGFRVGGGYVWVNTPWLHDEWESLMGRSHRVPTTRAIGQCLEGVSAGPQARLGPKSGDRPRYWPVSSEVVLREAEELGLGADEGSLRDHINRPLK